MATEIDLRQGKRADMIAYRGNTSAANIVCTQPATSEPFDLTGIEISFIISQATSETMATWTPGSGLLITGAAHNVISLLDFSQFPEGKYSYELKFKFPSGTETTYRAGELTITVRMD